jgi:hypothetical protein
LACSGEEDDVIVRIESLGLDHQTAIEIRRKLSANCTGRVESVPAACTFDVELKPVNIRISTPNAQSPQKILHIRTRRFNLFAMPDAADRLKSCYSSSGPHCGGQSAIAISKWTGLCSVLPTGERRSALSISAFSDPRGASVSMCTTMPIVSMPADLAMGSEELHNVPKSSSADNSILRLRIGIERAIAAA